MPVLAIHSPFRNFSCLVPFLLLLPLLQQFEAIEGAACPVRAAYIPEQSLGYPFSGIQSYVQKDGVTAVPLTIGQPGDFSAECCSSGRIVEWEVSSTEAYQYIAKVNATCSDGEQISTPLYGFNGTEQEVCENGTVQAQRVIQTNDEGVFPYEANDWLTTFLGVNGNWQAGNKGQRMTVGASSCPAGTRAIGIGARSSCYALLGLQVVCARTDDTQNNLGGILDRDSQCSTYQLASNKPIGNARAWNSTRPGFQKFFSAESNETQTECCPKNEGIAYWTVATSTFDSGNYTGFIQGRCTDDTVLAPITYGFNGTGEPLCNQQYLGRVYRYNTPDSQHFFYSDSTELGTLNSFMFPPDAKINDRLQLSCPEGQGAVGYSAASSCYSLSNFSILCGNLSDSARALVRKNSPTGVPNPPSDGDAGVCPGGMTMVPDDRYLTTDTKLPIGKIGAWSIDPIDGSIFKTDGTIYTSTAGPLTSVCCPSGQAITAFNVWPTGNINHMVGKVSVSCSSYADGRDPTDTGTIGHGFNGTFLNNTKSFCDNSTREMNRMALENSTWNYRAGWGFESLMEWPVRNATNAYGIVSGNELDRAKPSTASCPPGQLPMAFSARSSCWGLADFRVICGQVNLIPSADDAQPGSKEHSGLKAGAVVGIVVGAIVAIALVALLGFFIYRRHEEYKRRTSIGSRQLFCLNGPAGFYDGVTTAPQMSVPSSLGSKASARLISTGLMTIENIDCSEDNTPISFDGIPKEWEIKQDEIKLHCMEGKPIELGRGGFGVVLFGTVHKEDAAIKMIKGRNKENELLKEIAILERAKTKYVVRFLGYSVCPDGILLAMEYVSGGTLWKALRTSDEFQWYKRGQQAFKDICKGLYMLHRNQIVHLDMKTPNILIADDSTCKISDMGLGKLLHADANTCTAESTGSLMWMAPEQIMGRCGFASDIWSLSTIIWELCTLRQPTREALPSDIEVPGEAPQEVVDLMEACRRENAKDRPPIGTICDLLDSWEVDDSPDLAAALAEHVSIQM